MIIRFRRRTQSSKLILFVPIMSVVFTGLIDAIPGASAIKYTIDIAWCWLLILLIINNRQFPNTHSRTLARIVGLFAASTLVGLVLQYQSLLYYAWGVRNNLRFFVFFFACIFFLKKDDAETGIKMLDSLFWINIPIFLVQYLFLGIEQDYLGGIFGTTKGCNGYLNVFLVIVISKSVLQYVHGKETARMCFAKCAIVLLFGLLAELKVFFVEFVIIVAMAFLMSKFNSRKLMLVLSAILGLSVTLWVFSQMFPHFGRWFSLEGIFRIIGNKRGYTNANDLNRLTAIPEILQDYLKSGVEKLFGLGMGNCDTATFTFLQTPFYHQHKLTHYHWFSSAFMFLETGVIGFGLYLLFFVYVYIEADRREKNGLADSLDCQHAKIMAIMSLLLIFYNASMRTEAAYMLYFVMSIPFAMDDKALQSKIVQI